MGERSPRNKVKFMSSFGGKILPRPSDGLLKYVGGETRVIAVSPDITFAGKTTLKLLSLIELYKGIMAPLKWIQINHSLAYWPSIVSLCGNFNSLVTGIRFQVVLPYWTCPQSVTTNLAFS